MASPGCAPNAAAAYEFLVGRGLRDFQAAAVVGNLQWESGLDPTKAVVDTNGLMSRGIAMWQPPRWQNLLAFANGRDPLSLAVQLEFLWAELPSFGLQSLLSSTQLQDAVVVFQNQFEKPLAALAHTDGRVAFAQTALYACPAVRPPTNPPNRIGAFIVTTAALALVVAAGYGVYRAFAVQPEPEPYLPPDPYPPYRPVPYRQP